MATLRIAGELTQVADPVPAVQPKTQRAKRTKVKEVVETAPASDQASPQS